MSRGEAARLAAERERDELRARLNAAQAAPQAPGAAEGPPPAVVAAERERDALRARLEAAQAAPAAPEAPTVLIVESDRPPPSLTLWQRLRRMLGGA